MRRPTLNPKFIPNVTQIPNVVIDRIMRELSPAEFKVFATLVRKTFGWGQESEYISASQFVRLTGLTDTGVSKALKALQKLGLIEKISTGGGRSVNCWRVSIEVTFRTYPSGRRYVINSSAIPNIIFDEIMALISPAEFKALLLIARKTYGFHKDTDKIARSQFELYTGLSEPGVKKVLRSLQEKQLIERLNIGGGRSIAEWTINTSFVMPEYTPPNRVSPPLKTHKEKRPMPKSEHPSAPNLVSPHAISGSPELDIPQLPTEYPPAGNPISPQNNLTNNRKQNNLRETSIWSELMDFPPEIRDKALQIASRSGKQHIVTYVTGICRNLAEERIKSVPPNVPLLMAVLEKYPRELEIRYRYGNKIYLQTHAPVPEEKIRQELQQQGIEVVFLTA